MANRHTLHISKLEDFKKWLVKDGWEIEEPKGIYEVLRARKHGRQNPLIVYTKADAKEHLSIMDRDSGVIGAFLRDCRKPQMRDRALDEAIEQFKYDAECNRADLDLSFAEDNDKIAEWLEELKALRHGANELRSAGYEHGYSVGYNKAIDDFVRFANTMPTVVEEDGEIRPMWLEEMAEQLKAGDGE